MLEQTQPLKQQLKVFRESPSVVQIDAGIVREDFTYPVGRRVKRYIKACKDVRGWRHKNPVEDIQRVEEE